MIYFSSVIAVLYYLGTMQCVIKKIAWLMQRTMQTSASESLNAAGNIFVGQVCIVWREDLSGWVGVILERGQNSFEFTSTL